MLKELDKTTTSHQRKMSAQERSVLRKYSNLISSENKRNARTINELYKQRHKLKNR